MHLRYEGIGPRSTESDTESASHRFAFHPRTQNRPARGIATALDRKKERGSRANCLCVAVARTGPLHRGHDSRRQDHRDKCNSEQKIDHTVQTPPGRSCPTPATLPGPILPSGKPDPPPTAEPGAVFTRLHQRHCNRRTRCPEIASGIVFPIRCGSRGQQRRIRRHRNQSKHNQELVHDRDPPRSSAAAESARQSSVLSGPRR